jgi:hypothetical protein
VNFFQSNSFKKQRDYWYRKLIESGFEDIEKCFLNNQDESYLRKWDGFYFQLRYHTSRFKMIRDYYRYTSYFLENYCFDSIKEKRIWEMHSEGIPVRKISHILSLTVWCIQKTIQKLRKKMLIFIRTETD